MRAVRRPDMTKKSHIRKLADKRAMLWRERGFEQVIERDCELIGYLARDGRGLINATPMEAATA
jgi:hypothetical protein